MDLLDQSPDFQAVSIEGEEARLSDLLHRKYIILEFGCITCPYCIHLVPEMDQMYRDFKSRNVESIFVYTEEAHPGEIWPQHTSFEQKTRHARAFKQLYNVVRPIWVDSVDGNGHRLYGEKPNISFVIDTAGRVIFKSNWTDASVLKDTISNLTEMDRYREAGNEVSYFQTERVYYRKYDVQKYIEGIRRNGRKSLLDVGLKKIKELNLIP